MFIKSTGLCLLCGAAGAEVAKYNAQSLLREYQRRCGRANLCDIAMHAEALRGPLVTTRQDVVGNQGHRSPETSFVGRRLSLGIERT